ncbi:MAG: glycosyltransferase family 1 protein [Flavobacteriales bacterium TMED84]|nr:MAG: glycosyltransferase family 1 protein [Flavobacteriales bacterium TMED84]
MKIKVAIIDSIGSHGSSHHYYLFAQAKGLIENKVDVTIFSNKKTYLSSLGKIKVENTFGDIFKTKGKLANAIYFVSGILKSFFKAKFSSHNFFHLHLFDFNILNFFACFFAIFFNVRLILTIHDINPFSKKTNLFLKRWILLFADKVIVHNEFSKKELIKYVINLKKISVVPHGNYLDFIKPKTNKIVAKKKFGLQNKNVILFFGMIKEEKGLDILIKSFYEVNQNNKDVVLLIAGKTYKTDIKKYTKIIDQLDLENSCVIHNKFIPEDALCDYYGCADVIVLPYKIIFQSGVLMMSSSFNVPVIVSDLEPFLDIIENQINGLVFKVNDVKSLAEKLIFSVNSTEKMNSYAKNNFEKIKNQYDWTKIGKLNKDVYLYFK